jgi:hypothetical protein
MVLKIYDKKIKEIGKSNLDNLKIFYSTKLKAFVKFSFTDNESKYDNFLLEKFYFGDIWDLNEFISYIRNTYGYDL